MVLFGELQVAFRERMMLREMITETAPIKITGPARTAKETIGSDDRMDEITSITLKENFMEFGKEPVEIEPDCQQDRKNHQ